MRQPLPGALLGDDLGPLRRKGRIIRGLIQVIVRIEQRGDLRVGSQALQRSHHRIAGVRRPAVDDDQTFAGNEGSHVRSTRFDHRQPGGEPGKLRVLTALLTMGAARSPHRERSRGSAL